MQTHFVPQSIDETVTTNPIWCDYEAYLMEIGNRARTIQGYPNDLQ